LVRLAVRETNAAAIGLYRAHGFIEIGDDYLNPERVHRLILMAYGRMAQSDFDRSRAVEPGRLANGPYGGDTTTAPCRVRPLDA
jgi:hypothetical protein